MNKLIADFTVLYTKLHTYHYNVVGPEFYSMHIMLEKEYDTFHEWIDEAAESLMMAEEHPVASLKEMLELTSIAEAKSHAYTSKEILEDLISDYEELIKYMDELKETATMPQSNMLEEMITYLTKQIWFFKATLK